MSSTTTKSPVLDWEEITRNGRILYYVNRENGTSTFVPSILRNIKKKEHLQTNGQNNKDKETDNNDDSDEESFPKKQKSSSPKEEEQRKQQTTITKRSPQAQTLKPPYKTIEQIKLRIEQLCALDPSFKIAIDSPTAKKELEENSFLWDGKTGFAEKGRNILVLYLKIHGLKLQAYSSIYSGKSLTAELNALAMTYAESLSLPN